MGDQHIATPLHTQNKSLTYVEHGEKCRVFFLFLTFDVSRPICSCSWSRHGSMLAVAVFMCLARGVGCVFRNGCPLLAGCRQQLAPPSASPTHRNVSCLETLFSPRRRSTGLSQFAPPLVEKKTVSGQGCSGSVADCLALFVRVQMPSAAQALRHYRAGRLLTYM